MASERIKNAAPSAVAQPIWSGSPSRIHHASTKLSPGAASTLQDRARSGRRRGSPVTSELSQVLTQLTIVLAAATIAALGFHALKLPAVLGYILAGLLIGP